MRDLILHSAAVGLRTVAPVMFGDELLKRAFNHCPRSARASSGEPVPAIPEPPTVLDARSGAFINHDMRHRQRAVILVINPPCDRRNGPARNDLLDEHHSALHSVAVAPAYIEPQIHLIEVAMKRESEFRAGACSGTETRPGSRMPCPEINRAPFPPECAPQKRRVDLVIQQRKVAPLRGEKNARHGNDCFTEQNEAYSMWSGRKANCRGGFSDEE